MSTIHTRIVYRGTRQVIVDPRLDLWAYKPSKAPLSQEERALAASRVRSDGAWLRSP